MGIMFLLMVLFSVNFEENVVIKDRIEQFSLLNLSAEELLSSIHICIFIFESFIDLIVLLITQHGKMLGHCAKCSSQYQDIACLDIAKLLLQITLKFRNQHISTSKYCFQSSKMRCNISFCKSSYLRSISNLMRLKPCQIPILTVCPFYQQGWSSCT